MGPQETQVEHRVRVQASQHGHFNYTHQRLKVHPGQTIIWNSPDGDLGIRFTGLTPGENIAMTAPQGTDVSDVVREDAAPGTYKYIVAVSRNHKVFIDDPEVIVET